ncbi:hypothetical protein Tco_0366564 [Tanacetum coccineum]
MEAAVDQCYIDKNVFEIQIKQLRIDNDQLLNQIMSQEIVHIVVNSVDICDVKKSCVNNCKKCLEHEIELFKKKDFIEKVAYDKLVKSYLNLEKHCISLDLATQLNQEIFQRENSGENLNAPIFNQLFEINELKAQSQEKDTVIRKLKEIIKSLSRKDRDDHEWYAFDKTLEYTDTLCGFGESASSTQNPSEPLLESTYVPSSSYFVNDKFSRSSSGIWTLCDNRGLSRLHNQSIERERLIGIGFVLDFMEFISFTFGDKEMISLCVLDRMSTPTQCCDMGSDGYAYPVYDMFGIVDPNMKNETPCVVMIFILVYASMGYPTDGSFTFWKSFFTPQWRFLVHHLLHCISSKSGGWDQFGSNIATALICLSTGRVYNFSKLIFDGMVGNLKRKTKFLMFPLFLQLILDIQTENKHPYLAVTLTKKIFRNMKRGFRGAPRPLLPAMLLVATTNPSAGQGHPDVAQSQPSSSTIPVPSTSSPPVQSPPPIPAPIPTPTPTPIPETDPEPLEHTFEEPSPAHQHFSPPQEHAQGQMTVDDLLRLVPQLVTRIDSLETDLKQIKLTMGSAIVKLVKKVKKLEGILKRRNMDLSVSEEEEPEAQGRKSQDDPLVSLVQGLVTPSKTTVNASGEEQVKDISPTTLEAAKTLSRVASQKPKSIDKGRSINVSTVSGQEEASLAEAIRLDTLQKEEKAKQVHLDSLLAQRLAEKEELNEQQKKRRAQVQFEAQHYTNEDWDLIRAKIEANAELSKSVLGSDLQGEDFAKKMVELGTWKLSQLKNLSFEEVKEEFDKLVKQVESFAPINFEATKDSLKRFGEELQTKTSKRLKSDEAKDDESTKKTGKRRKQIARKGLHSDKTDEDESEASKDADPISGTNIPINPVPVAIKPPSIATYKIIKQGKEGVYQIVREDGTDIVYINFGAMLKDITRDDLTELYRIVMNRYGMNGPEDELEKVLWEYLKNMFEAPLSTDPIWSLLGQQRIISWRYYNTCRVHCLNLESSDIYMLTERKYPLSAEVCKAMLDKKLQGGKPNEDCYKLLKMMEKQAGIRKHKDWLVQEQTALGKDFSNPLMADNLPKIVWLSTHHIWIARVAPLCQMCQLLEGYERVCKDLDERLLPCALSSVKKRERKCEKDVQ